MNNFIKTSFGIFLLSLSCHSFSATVPSSTPSMKFIKPNYGVFCQNWIDAIDFKPTAMKPIMDTENTLYNDLYSPVYNAVLEATFDITQVAIDSLNKIKQSDIEQNNIAHEKNLTLQKQLQNYELEHTQELEAQTKKSKSKIFDDDNGEASKAYFMQLCSKAKIAELTGGSDARYKESVKVTAGLNRAIREQTEIASNTSDLKRKQDQRYEVYCSYEDKTQGLCETVSQMQNADLDAGLFLNPVGYKGSGEGSDINFKTRFTYNPRELDAAKLYIDNVIGTIGVEPPTANETNDPKKQQFIAMYKSNMSAMSLARYSYEYALNQRKPLGNKDTKLSKFDLIHHQLEDLNDGKVKTIEAASGGNGKKIAMYMALALNAKLQMEIYMQKERLAILEAALLAQDENSAQEQRFMNIRK